MTTGTTGTIAPTGAATPGEMAATGSTTGAPVPAGDSSTSSQIFHDYCTESFVAVVLGVCLVYAVMYQVSCCSVCYLNYHSSRVWDRRYGAGM